MCQCVVLFCVTFSFVDFVIAYNALFFFGDIWVVGMLNLVFDITLIYLPTLDLICTFILQGNKCNG